MDVHITYDQWLSNMLSHVRDLDSASVEDCPKCQNNFDPSCYLCDGSGVLVHDEDGHKINVSVNAYNRQLEHDKVRWRKHMERRK